MDIKHIFFDLDHTLWDFDKNSKLTFQQIFIEQHIQINIDVFLEKYMPINFNYWKLYREDKISKEALRYGRLKDSFDQLNYTVSDKLINLISEDYIKYLPNNNHLFDGTFEILEYLSKKYDLHIITNGFEEVQKLKLEKSGIAKYFNQVITSESVGVKKPNIKVFEYALSKAKAQANNCLMIGDSYEADVMGSIKAGMLAIHFTSNTSSNGELTVNSLLDLKRYL